jgi:nucleoside-diphosphate-sugar epimerase
MTDRPRVLVTGLSGLIGGALLAHLRDRYDVRGLNRRPVAGVPCVQADIADLDAIQPAFAGVATVVHLAALADSSAPFDAILRANVIGTHNVFEAARRAGVRRVIFASSGSTVSAYERDEPWRTLVAGRYEALPRGADGQPTWPMITTSTPTRPAAFYGVSKVSGEALARHYADAYGLSMICVRIGHVSKEDRPLVPREYSVWCSQRDVVRGIELAIVAPETLRYEIVFVTSGNRWGYRDLEHTRAVLGYEPMDAAEDHR